MNAYRFTLGTLVTWLAIAESEEAGRKLIEAHREDNPAYPEISEVEAIDDPGRWMIAVEDGKRSTLTVYLAEAAGEHIVTGASVWRHLPPDRRMESKTPRKPKRRGRDK